jgi:hypothetical protein
MSKSLLLQIRFTWNKSTLDFLNIPIKKIVSRGTIHKKVSTFNFQHSLKTEN